MQPGADNTVLIVDDDASIRAIVSDVLQEAGFSVGQAVDGRDAIRWLSARERPPPALILLDLMMPRMDGYEFHGWLRAQRPEIAETPVVVFSATGNAVAAATQLGAAAGLPKPASIETLLRLVSRLASGRAMKT